VKKITLIILSLLFSTYLIAQHKEANVWVFGKKTGLNFNVDPPVAFNENLMLTQEGCASIADAEGNLLFYTDGVQIWNSENDIMETGLNGHFSSTQSGVIVPKPDSPNIFYVFTVPYQGEPEGLQYSVVDMTLNNGLGDVTEKNIQLVTPVDEKVTAMSHDNAEDIWVITHEWQYPLTPGGDTIPSNKFVAYLVTKDGIDIDNPVVSAVGLAHGGNDLNTVGYLKGSPGNNRIALAMYYDEVYQLFDFDNATGLISNPITFTGYKKAYGLEFSPNSRILYLTEEDSIDLKKMHIYQFDLLAGNAQAIINSRNYIGYTTNDAAIGRGAMQVGPDQRIYIAKGELPYLGVINNPNLWGGACELVDEGIWLESNTAHISKYGLPTFIQSYFSPPAFEYTNNCFGESTEFWITTDISEATGVEWDFGDGGYSTDETPTHVFSEAGQHIVKLTVHYISTVRHAEESIIILTSPLPSFTYDPYCIGSPTQFYDDSDPISGEIIEWEWDFGDGTSNLQNPQHTFGSGGQKTVGLYVKTDNGCFNTDNGTTNSISLPGTPGQPSGPSGMCQDSENSQYTTSGHPDAVEYEWELTPSGAGTIGGSTATGTVNWSPTFNGTATIKVKSINVCGDKGSFSNPFQVTIYPFPDAYAGADRNADFLTTVTFSDANVSGSNPFEYYWTPVDSLQPGQHTILQPETIQITGTTIYVLKATDANNCIDHDTVKVTKVGGPVSAYVSANSSAICFGNSTTIFAAAEGGSGNYDYDWTSDPAGFASSQSEETVSPSETTTYYVTVKDANNPDNNYSGSVVLVVKPLPYITTPDTIICFNGVTATLSSENEAGNGAPYEYIWEPNDLIPINGLPNVETVQLFSDKVFTVNITDSFGCGDADTTFVRVSDDALAVEASVLVDSICSGELSELEAIGYGGDPTDYTYSWSPPYLVDDPGAPLTATKPLYASQTFEVTINDGYNINTSTVEVTVHALPDIDLIPLGASEIGQDSIITCIYDTIYLKAGEFIGYDYQWSSSVDDTLAFIEVWTTGIGFDIQQYSVVVQNQETMCMNSSEITIFYSFDYCEEGIADKEFRDEYMYAYPNPSTGKTNVAMRGIMGDSEMYIMNMTGQTVHSEKVSNRSNQESVIREIDIGGNPKGIYIIFLVNDKGLHTDKIILQ